MLSTGLHNDFDDPPEIPAFQGSTPKRARRESLSDAISGAAVAFTDSLKSRNENQSPASTSVLASGISPGRSVELRMKNYEQLRYLQQLYDDGILSTEEY